MLAELADARVEAIVFKGAAALDGLYADPGARPMDDADLLVRATDRERAATVLVRLGFEPVPIDEGRLGPVGPSLHAAQAYRRRVGALAVEVDLHWQPISDARLRAAFPGAADPALWSRADWGVSGLAAVGRPSRVDAAILTAATQIFGHPWSHPLGYLDLRLLVEDFGPAEWQALVEQTRALGLAAPVYWGLRFTAELFGGAVGEPEMLAPGGLTRRLGERLIGGDWLGLAPARRDMPARDLFVLLAAGPAGTLRMARAGLVDREANGRRRLATLDPRSSARTVVWLAQAAFQTLGPRPARG
jgi:hypothetical protein